jgi:hypothetical protein
MVLIDGAADEQTLVAPCAGCHLADQRHRRSPLSFTLPSKMTTMPDPIAALRQAAETVRDQIPKGELTRASVERLLEAAEAVCADASRPRSTPARMPSPASRRQEAREKWARIARQNQAADGAT